VTGESFNVDHFTRIGCFTCHAPHSSGTLQMRVSGPVTLGDGTAFDNGSGNTCASCHQGRRDAESYVEGTDTLSTHFGPHHSNQADMLMGVNAWEYEDYEYSDDSPHRHAPDACVHCHMAPMLYATGGHAFYLDDEEHEYENITGCNTGCHAGNVESLNHENVQEDIESMLSQLEILLDNAGLMEWVMDEGELVFEPVDGRPVMSADSAGAVFNYLYVYEDRSHGVHNPDYAMDVLQSTIDFMTNGGAPHRISTDPIAAH
jgi:formate-dependent nitrite reductase cytochrome c552 subunit